MRIAQIEASSRDTAAAHPQLCWQQQAQAGGAPVGYSLLLTSQPTGPRTNIEIRSGGEQRLASLLSIPPVQTDGCGCGG